MLCSIIFQVLNNNCICSAQGEKPFNCLGIKVASAKVLQKTYLGVSAPFRPSCRTAFTCFQATHDV